MTDAAATTTGYLYRDLGNRFGEAETLNAIGELLLASSAPAEARSRHDQALMIATGITAAAEEARALEGIGRCHLHNGEPGKSAEPLHHALAIYQRIGSIHSARVQKILNDHGI